MGTYNYNNTGAAREGASHRAAQAQLATKGPYRIVDNVNVRPDVSANEGLVIYQLDTNKMYVSDGTTWQDLWTAYSDGAASGLDADLLDGQHGSYYQDATNINAGTLATARGGTSNGTYAVGDILYASTTSLLTRLTAVATGNALISGGVGVAPSWGKIGLTTHVSGTLPIANGGTGVASLTPASFTPTLTGVTVGNGTFVGSQLTVGKLCFYAWRFTLGSTSAITGAITATHPASVLSGYTPVVSYVKYFDTSASVSAVGQAQQVTSPAVLDLYAINAAGTYDVRAALSSTVPFTWAVGDYIEVACVALLA